MPIHKPTHQGLLLSSSGKSWRVLLHPVNDKGTSRAWTTSYGAWYDTKTGLPWKASPSEDRGLWLDLRSIKRLG